MMSALKFSFFVCLLTCFLKSSVSEELKANPGDDVTLQCFGSRGGLIRLLQWIRPDLESEGSVYFFRENRSYKNYQHPSFRDRVEPRDPQMKDGDFSLILKEVNVGDTGTYECHGRIKDGSLELISSTHLTVEDPGDAAGQTEDGGNQTGYIVAGGTVGALLLLGGIIGIAVAAG